VDVGIYPTWQHCQAAQVVVQRPSLGVNRNNLRTVGHDASVVQGAALTIENFARSNHQALALPNRLGGYAVRRSTDGKYAGNTQNDYR